MTKRYEFDVFHYSLPADWQEAEFFSCSFYDIDFTGADLSKVKFEGRTDFCFCNFQDANFNKADPLKFSTSSSGRFQFVSCNLQDTNFEDVDISKFEFKNCYNIPQYVYDKTLIVLQEGDVIGWKKCRGGAIVQLLIPDGVPRHNATGRKCRAERAIVLGIWDRDGNEITEAESLYNSFFIYRTGETVVSYNYNPNRWNECSGGIHFFLTREEAVDYIY